MSDDFKVQWSVSLPPSAQYAKGDMLNLRGESVEEVEAIFDQVLAGEFLQKATDVSRLLNAAAVVNGGGQPAAAQPAAEQPSNVTSLRTCAHGVRTKRTGTSSRGAWTGWFCPLPKGDPAQCKAEFE